MQCWTRSTASELHCFSSRLQFSSLQSVPRPGLCLRIISSSSTAYNKRESSYRMQLLLVFLFLNKCFCWIFLLLPWTRNKQSSQFLKHAGTTQRANNQEIKEGETHRVLLGSRAQCWLERWNAILICQTTIKRMYSKTTNRIKGSNWCKMQWSV